MIVPALDPVEGDSRSQILKCLIQPLKISADTHLRVMGSHHQRNSPFDPVLSHLRHDLSNAWLPVTHTDISPEAGLAGLVQMLFQRFCLQLSDFQDR